MKVFDTKTFSLFFLCIFSVTLGISQDWNGGKNNLRKKGDNHFSQGDYPEAIKAYSGVLNESKQNAKLHYKLGISYLHLNQGTLALHHLGEAQRNGYGSNGRPSMVFDEVNRSHVTSELNFNLGRVHHMMHNFEEARLYYQKSLHKYKTAYRMQWLSHRHQNVVKQHIEMAENGKYAHEVIDYHYPTITLNQNHPVFAHVETVERFFGKESVGVFEERSLERQFGDLKIIVNKEHHSGASTISVSRKGEYGWSLPLLITDEMKSANVQYGVCYSGDNSQLFFTTETSDHNLDIRSITFLKNGKWSNPVSLGQAVNSDRDEDAPYFHSASNTLYFSSKGHNSIGGYDVFKSIFDPVSGLWSEPQNLGLPVNSAHDEMLIKIDDNTQKAYVIRKELFKSGGFEVLEIPMAPYSKQQILINGVIRDELTGYPVRASIEVVDDHTGHVMAAMIARSPDGEFNFSVPASQNYYFLVKTEGYEPKEYRISGEEGQFVHQLEINLSPIQNNSVFNLEKVNFHSGSAKLHLGAHHSLKMIEEFMKLHPDISIEIAGHTEPGATEEYNLELSQGRAESVKHYLQKKGVSSERLIAVGYGGKFPLTHDSKNGAKKANRRTEIIIIKSGIPEDYIPYYLKK